MQLEIYDSRKRNVLNATATDSQKRMSKSQSAAIIADRIMVAARMVPFVSFM